MGVERDDQWHDAQERMTDCGARAEGPQASRAKGSTSVEGQSEESVVSLSDLSFPGRPLFSEFNVICGYYNWTLT